ncbi:MAG: hypothetical protein GW802_37790, partial [Armatimonadetes bacterium]|nr:hypothetical protein [Armatimonadota bacterium]
MKNYGLADPSEDWFNGIEDDMPYPTSQSRSYAVKNITRRAVSCSYGSYEASWPEGEEWWGAGPLWSWYLPSGYFFSCGAAGAAAGEMDAIAGADGQNHQRFLSFTPELDLSGHGEWSGELYVVLDGDTLHFCDPPGEVYTGFHQYPWAKFHFDLKSVGRGGEHRPVTGVKVLDAWISPRTAVGHLTVSDGDVLTISPSSFAPQRYGLNPCRYIDGS